jgi:predicted ATPase
VITRWKVFNFKSVRKETELEFAPLTIFAGANSSGKSTFLQSILLVAQTLAHKVSSRSVVLNGALARLGQFDDLKSADSEANQIVIGWTCRPHRDSHMARRRPAGLRRGPAYYAQRGRVLSSALCEIAFETEESGDQRDATQIQPRLFSALISAVARELDGGDCRYSMAVRRASTADYTSKRPWIEAAQADDSFARPSMQYEVELDDASLAEIREDLASAQPVGCVLRHFLPERLSLGVNLGAENARLIVATLTGDGPRGLPRGIYLERDVAVPGKTVDLVLRSAEKAGGVEQAKALREKLYQPALFDNPAVSLEFLVETLRRLPTQLRHEMRRELSETDDFEELVRASIREEHGEQPAVVPYRPPSAIAEASWYLDQFFANSVRYLGPLRDEPKSLYPLAPSAHPADVGLKGEHTAAVLELHKNRQVKYLPTSAFASGEITPREATRSLEVAVVDWLQYLGVAESVQSRDRGKFGHELTVNVAFGRRPHDLTHVGVGVSQVLPILVASLLAEPDTTLVFEQPELHLHPRVQTLLADFFLSMTWLGKQCVIETHSEYLVSRLRFRAAAATATDPWVDAIKIYFVEMNEEGSSFRAVKMNEYGAIPDWPEGFFDQSQREAESILRAAAMKRKSKREKK